VSRAGLVPVGWRSLRLLVGTERIAEFPPPLIFKFL